MVKILHTVLDLGVEHPVKVLHITDTHITESNDDDDQRMKDLIKMRRETFIKEGKYAPRTPQEYLDEAFEIAEKEGAFPVLTGDIQDLNSAGNRVEMHKHLDGKDFLFTAGTHEFQRSSCTHRCSPIEEPEGYYTETRKALTEEFAGFGNWDFDNRIIGGVNIITVDNSQGTFTKATLEGLKREEEKGLPMILFMHVPLNSGEITYGLYEESLLTAEEFRINMEAYTFIKTCPLIKATFAGHWHCDNEYPKLHPPVYVTPGTYAGIVRMIEIK